MAKMRGYVEILKDKEVYNGKNNKLMSFRIDDPKLLGKYKLFGLRLKT